MLISGIFLIEMLHCDMVMKIRLLKFITFLAISTLLWSCATNSARSLIKASKSSDPILPDELTIAQELEGRAYKLGKVQFDPVIIVENQADIPDEAYPILLQGQLQKAFVFAGLTQGELPSYAVDILIDRLKFTSGTFVIANPSILHVTMEIKRPDGTTLMRGALESRYLPTLTFMLPTMPTGVVTLPTSFEGQEWLAIRKMIPAMAIAITRVTSGLQSGKDLDSIEVYPDDLMAGAVIVPDSFLRGKPYGLSELTAKDIDTAVNLDQDKCIDRGPGPLQFLCNSADSGDTNAQYKLGLYFDYGIEGLPKDQMRAYVWYEIAAASGSHMTSASRAKQLQSVLSEEQVLQAKQLIRDWIPGWCEKDLSALINGVK